MQAGPRRCYSRLSRKTERNPEPSGNEGQFRTYSKYRVRVKRQRARSAVGTKYCRYLAAGVDFSYLFPPIGGRIMAAVLIVLAVVLVGRFLVVNLTDRPLDYIPR